jgi:hypothetical protein
VNKKAMIFLGVILALVAFAAPALALSWNPLDWVKTAAESGAKGLAGIAFGALIAWLGKGKWDQVQLKRAVAEIKSAVDSVRMANDANSPGGNKVTVGEMVPIAEKSLSAILFTLRGINPKWIPHWVDIK